MKVVAFVIASEVSCSLFDNFQHEFEFRGGAKSDTSPWINTTAWSPHGLIMTITHNQRMFTEPGSMEEPLHPFFLLILILAMT